MDSVGTAAASPNGASTAQELFALTDEQILEIEPEPEVASEPQAASGEQAVQTAAHASPAVFGADATSRLEGGARNGDKTGATKGSSVAQKHSVSRPEGGAQAGMPAPPEPPKWLADMMADPQVGAEARDVWSGLQQARQEAAAFREVFAKPEDARTAAERARALDEIDAAFYGGAGKSPQEMTAARTALAQRMMRDDPDAFREMVFAGLRALEEAALPEGTSNVAHVSSTEALQQASHDSSTTGRNSGGPPLGMTERDGARAHAEARDAQVAAYRAFEKSANEDLERSVGGAIDRALTQALPNISKASAGGQGGAQHSFGSAEHRGGPLQAKLQAAIREDIEATLQGDRQLGEQIGQILASRQFDDTTRAQVVRLINDRAQQLVPLAAKRVINDWTQTTLAAHRAKTQKAEVDTNRADIPPAEISAGTHRHQPGQSGQPASRKDGSSGARIDYRKLSDEQILDL